MHGRWLLVGLILAPLLPAGCNRTRPGLPTMPTPNVVVRTPQQKSVSDYEFYTGRVEAPESVDIRARVTGYLTKINFTPGGEVKKNQLLFKIDPRPYQAQVDISKGQLKLDQAQLKLAIAELNIATEVAKTPGAISQSQIEKRNAEKLRAEAAVEATKASLEYNEINLGFTDVISPIDGIVSRYFFSEGNLVNQDQTLLTTVVSQDPLWVYFNVDERTMLRLQALMREGKLEPGVKAKAPVDIGLPTEGDTFPHQGNLDFVNNQVDRSTGTITARAVIANPAPPKGPRLFKPGLFVRVRVPIGPPHPALLVPEEAIGIDQGKRFVYVVNAQNEIEYRPVTPGSQQAGGLRVIEPVLVVRDDKGLHLAGAGEKGEPSVLPSDRVVIRGLQRIRPGQKVEVTEAK